MGSITDNFSGDSALHLHGGAGCPPRRPEPTARPISLKGGQWQRERAARLQRICGCIEHRTSRGQRLDRAARHFARAWRDRRYRSDPARRIRLSAKTIIRSYYVWLAAGRNEAAFRLGYRGPRLLITQSQIRKFLRVCLSPQVQSFNGAWRKLARPAGHPTSYRYAVAARRNLLKQVFAARREAARWQRRLERCIYG